MGNKKARNLVTRGVPVGGGQSNILLDFSILPDGDLPSRLLGPTWAIVSGQAVCTPSVGDTDIIVNGTFDADTDWNKGAGWTIPAGGKAVATASTALLYNASATLAAATIPFCEQVTPDIAQNTTPDSSVEPGASGG